MNVKFSSRGADEQNIFSSEKKVGFDKGAEKLSVGGVATQLVPPSEHQSSTSLPKKNYNFPASDIRHFAKAPQSPESDAKRVKRVKEFVPFKTLIAKNPQLDPDFSQKENGTGAL